MKTYLQIKQSSQAARQLRDHMVKLEQEELWAIYLNNSNYLLAKEMITRGSLSSTVFDIRTIVKRSLMNNAAAIILLHNHPSGNAKPSQADIIHTEQAKKACDLMDIRFLDHIIISLDSYFSFADEKVTSF